MLKSFARCFLIILFSYRRWREFVEAICWRCGLAGSECAHLEVQLRLPPFLSCHPMFGWLPFLSSDGLTHVTWVRYLEKRGTWSATQLTHVTL